MSPEDRLEQILALISQKGTISVNELTAALYVSTATVRRDLTELSRRGLIVRSFGGAVSTSRAALQMLPAHTVQQAETPLGSHAAQFAKEKSVVFLGASPLLLTLLPYLRERPSLTVVTDSARAAIELTGHVAQLFCTGGRYDPAGGFFCGQQAAETVESFRYDCAFFACDGLGADGSLLFRSAEEMSVLQTAAEHAKTRVLLCAREQLSDSAAWSLLKLRQMDAVVTDAPDLIGRDYAGTVISIV